MKRVFIVNKGSASGNGRLTWEKIEDYLKKESINYEVYFTQGKDDATRLAEMVTSKGEMINLYVCGGDGTLNEALNGIKDFDKTFYTPIPAGSANDFIKGIGLDGTGVEIVKRTLSKNDFRLFDIGKVVFEGGDRLFGVSSGIGVDAYVCLQALTSKLKVFLNKIGLGQATYGLLTVGDIFTMPFSDARLTITRGDQVVEKDVKNTIFAAAMNCSIEGGGIPMSPDATADSGHLSLFHAHDISRLRCLFTLPAIVAGKHIGKPGVDLDDFDKATVVFKDKMCLHADGEHLGFYKEISFECLPRKLKIKGF
ncbi:MAG: diacylglycerol kinase family lipid kinase [Pseudobutyrivibrio sp.]|nr:diacylglycerol kinase family lipid kinase [Pseudobutyrivibrio sp.]